MTEKYNRYDIEIDEEITAEADTKAEAERQAREWLKENVDSVNLKALKVEKVTDK